MSINKLKIAPFVFKITAAAVYSKSHCVHINITELERKQILIMIFMKNTDFSCILLEKTCSLIILIWGQSQASRGSATVPVYFLSLHFLLTIYTLEIS